MVIAVYLKNCSDDTLSTGVSFNPYSLLVAYN